MLGCGQVPNNAGNACSNIHPYASEGARSKHPVTKVSERLEFQQAITIAVAASVAAAAAAIAALSPSLQLRY